MERRNQYDDYLSEPEYTDVFGERIATDDELSDEDLDPTHDPMADDTEAMTADDPMPTAASDMPIASSMASDAATTDTPATRHDRDFRETLAQTDQIGDEQLMDEAERDHQNDWNDAAEAEAAHDGSPPREPNLMDRAKAKFDELTDRR